jgi:hypothetical protein
MSERLDLHGSFRRHGSDRRGRRFRWGLDSSNKAVAAARERLDPTRAVGGVVESVAEAIDGGVEAMLEIDKGVRGPKQGAELLASDKVTRVVQQHLKNLKGLRGNTYALPVAEQFPGREIGLKRAKTNS